MHAPEPPIAAVRALDPVAIDALVTHYAPRLVGFLRRLGASPQVAEELVQETFVRLVRHAPGLRDDTRVGAWCFTVARNLWRSHRRWAWVDGTRLLELAGLGPAVAAGPDDALALRRTQDRLEAAVAALPEAQREVFLLVVVEGLSPQEAADALHVTPENARQRLARARRQLEEALR
jgi:RNA polymerase sigma-70 factor (ECF subfamily)